LNFLVSPGTRFVAGAVMAAATVVVAFRRRSLTSDGAFAAFVLGTICSAAGWGWAALLFGLFITGTLLSRYKCDLKSERVASVVEKGGNRDAWQVLANGGVFTAAAAMSIVQASPVWMALGAGAIGAAAADTWATEIGVLSSSTPRSILTGRPVTTGQSGGVTLTGTFAGALGAVAMALIVSLAGWGDSMGVAAIIGGIGGCTLDSVLGASFQVRRWCDHCNTITEREVHDCGTTTRVVGGLTSLDNDAVNAVSSAFGALLGLLWLLATPP
jgi:uncharacterized protein (TIGR00297 family)